MISKEEIEAVIATGDISVALQPIFELEGLTVAGYEALSRFKGADDTGEWFAAAREHDLTVELDLACLARIAETAPGHARSGFLSINVTCETLTDPRLHETIDHLVDVHHDVVIEISEEVSDPEAMIVAAEALRGRGVRVALDDFGAGTLNAMHLRAIAPDILKVDNRVLRGLGEFRITNALLNGFVAFATRTGITLIVERVETHDEMVAVWSSGAHCAQGFNDQLGRPAVVH